MKKSKMITGFSAAFVTLMALTSCGGLLKSKDGVVLTINGVDYKASDLFQDQKSAAASEAKFNAVYKVAVRNYFNTDQKGKDKLPDIQREARNKVNGQKDVARSNASKSGTSYEAEWNKILNSNGVKDENGLYDKFEYDLEKEKFDDQFYEDHLETLKKGGELTSGVSVDGYLPKKQPYHVKHILVKVSAAENDPTTAEIKPEEAQKIHDVVNALMKGEDFGKVANWYSDDTGSKEKYGDLGIMDRNTSFVNEFKLGTYLYESYFGSSTTTAKDKLFPKDPDGNKTKAETYAEQLTTLADPSGVGKVNEQYVNQGIGQIPCEAALILGDKYTINGVDYDGYAKVTDDTQNFKKFMSDKVAAKYYPRNVIFNKYFNKNNIMVITPRRLTLNTALVDKQTTTISNIVKNYVDIDTEGKYRISDDKYRGTVNSDLEALPGFTKSPKNDDILRKTIVDDNDKINAGAATSNIVLRNQEGRIIFVFRSGTSGDSSYQGIHFVCIERSPFIENEIDSAAPAGATNKEVSLDEYYTYCYPTQVTTTGPGYPKYNDPDHTDKPTYVNDNPHVEVTELKSRADSVKSKIKGYDSNLNIKIYQYLFNTGNLKFKEGTDEAAKLAQAIKHDIETWIDRKYESIGIDDANSWDKTWKEYAWKMQENTKRRIVQKDGSDHYYGGLISEACAIAFANYNANNAEGSAILKKLFETGGAFHD